MRIAYTADQLLRCGGIRVPFEHCRELRRRGHDARIFAHGWEDGIRDWLDRYEVKAYPLEDLRTFDADVLVSVWWPMLDELLAYPARKRYHLVQGQDWRSYPEGHDWREKNAMAMHREDYRYIAVSPWAGASCRQPMLVPNGVDSDFWRPAAFAQLRAEKRILIEASTDDAMKGTADAFAAAAMVKAERHDVRIWFITKTGHDPRADKVLANVNDVTILNAYQNCDVLIKASHFEGFGLPHLEAMAAGLPLITTACGGNDFCVNGLNCTIVPFEEIVDFTAGAIRTIFDNKDYRDSIIRHGRETAHAMSWRVTGDALVDALTTP